MTMLQSYLAGRWASGAGPGTPLVDPTREETIATASAVGLDRAAALTHARQVGGPALRAMGFPARAAALGKLAAAIHACREELIEIGVRNAGNTRGDAKFDIDGATATLSAYAELGAGLPDRPALADGELLQLGRSPRFAGQHLLVPRHGVAVHINAFNFPAWGQAEKMACALLAGVPVLEKPGTPTALMAERIAQIVVESGALPEGAYSFLAGEAGDLLEHLGAQDGVAFTGSSATAQRLAGHAAFVQRGARLNVEADSLNAAVLGPDVEPDSETFDLFVREHAREITQKAGQKCTATRRLFVPAAIAPAVAEALGAALSAVKVGDPAAEGTRMGPLTNAEQLAAVQQGITRLAGLGTLVVGGPERLFARGCFLGATLVLARDAHADALHAEEVFGPVATIAPYSGEADEAVALVARGGGGLVASVYSDDRSWPVRVALGLAPWTGRVYLGSARVAEYGTGPGLVLPSMTHGGPGRAGGGEELGGLRGLSFWMQRTALQGFRGTLEAACG